MNSTKIKKTLIKLLPYIIVGLVCTNLGEAWRLAEGADMGKKMLIFFSMVGVAFGNPLPSLNPLDLLVGTICGGGLRLAVYLRGKNAKHYRHNEEYGSARWGTHTDIEPFMDPKFENNVILTATERLMMSNRPKNPANARNKNVLIVGGSYGPLGSARAQLHLRQILASPEIQANVLPGKEFLLGDVQTAIDSEGELVDPSAVAVLEDCFADFVRYVQALQRGWSQAQ